MNDQIRHLPKVLGLQPLKAVLLVAIISSVATVAVAVPIISNVLNVGSYTIKVGAPVDAGVLTQVSAATTLPNPTGINYATTTELTTGGGSVYSTQWYKTGFRFYSVNGYAAGLVKLNFKLVGVITSGTPAVSIKFWDLKYGTWTDITFTYDSTTKTWTGSMPTDGFGVPVGYNTVHTVLIKFDGWISQGSVTISAWVEQI